MWAGTRKLFHILDFDTLNKWTYSSITSDFATKMTTSTTTDSQSWNTVHCFQDFSVSSYWSSIAFDLKMLIHGNGWISRQDQTTTSHYRISKRQIGLDSIIGVLYAIEKGAINSFELIRNIYLCSLLSHSLTWRVQ